MKGVKFGIDKDFPEKRELELGLRQEKDVLCIGTREPQKALGVDIGGSAIVRYIESSGKVVGITLIG